MVLEGQTEWGILIALYLFFAGIGSGAYLVTVWNELTAGVREKFEFRWGAYLSWPLVTIGMSLLVLDLGRPERAFSFVNVFVNPSSLMAWGSWILVIFIIFGFLTSLLWIGCEGDRTFGRRVLKIVSAIPSLKSRKLRYGVETVGFFLAISTASYTGLLLGVVVRIPFWHTPLLPPLFMVSALTTGLGIVGILQSISYYRTKPSDDKAFLLEDISLKVDTYLVAIIVLETLMILSYVLIMLSSVGAARASAELLLYREYASVFWSGIALLGLVAPIILTKTGTPTRKTVPLSVIGFLSVHLGSLFLRYGILLAGVPVAVP